MCKSVAVLAIVACALCVSAAAADDDGGGRKTWKGGNGRWEDPEMWEPRGVPDPTHEVVIPSNPAGEPQTITVSNPKRVAGLYILVSPEGKGTTITGAAPGGAVAIESRRPIELGKNNAVQGADGNAAGGDGGMVKLSTTHGGITNHATVKGGSAVAGGKNGGDVSLDATGAIENYGAVAGGNGAPDAGAGDGGKGGDAILKSKNSNVTNRENGDVTGGNGGAALGAGKGGDGGRVALNAPHTPAGTATNKGKLRGGNGGAGKAGGNGGSVTVSASHSVVNDDLGETGGNGGDGNAVNGKGGDGGSVVNRAGERKVDVGKKVGGVGGTGRTRGTDGKVNGKAPQKVKVKPADKLRGQAAILETEPGGQLELRGLQAGALFANREAYLYIPGGEAANADLRALEADAIAAGYGVYIDVGPDGVVDLRDIPSDRVVIAADAEVCICAAGILVDPNVDVASLVRAPRVRLDSECLTPPGVLPPGDMNCDGVVDYQDVDPLVLALAGPDAYYESFASCQWLNADCNLDGQVDFDDVDVFVALLGQ